MEPTTEKPHKEYWGKRHPLLSRIVTTVLMTLILFAIAFTVYWIKKDSVVYTASSWTIFGIAFILIIYLFWKSAD